MSLLRNNNILPVHCHSFKPEKPARGEEDEEDLPGDSKTRLVPGEHSVLELPEQGRQQWSRPLEFLLSCVSLSVGLGNVWRFPMTAYQNGGGAFLIPYFVVLTFIGRPLYFMELAMGQFSSSGSVRVWKMVPAAKGVGYGQMVGTWSVVTYYCSLMALSVFYLSQCFSSVLPWSVCDPAWADQDCLPASVSAAATNATNLSESSTQQYYERFVLHEAASVEEGLGLPDWRLALCLLATWVILFVTLCRGVHSSGKVAYFTAVFPYLVLAVLLVRSVTLPGASQGIQYFFRPEWHRLLDPAVWYAAVTQSFFSLSVGMGSIITFSSYNDFKHNVYRDAWIISLADTLTSLLAGVTIFSILGSLAHHLGDDVSEVVRGGPGLAFVSYPEALAKFDYASQVFAVLFFLMLFTLGVGTASALTTNILTVLSDKFPSWSRTLLAAATCLSGFLLGLVYVTPGGQWVLELVDFFGGGFIIFVLVIFEVVAVSYIYGINRFTQDVEFMLGTKLTFYWKFCWAGFIPPFLTVTLLYSLSHFQLPTFNGEPLPTAAYLCGWLLAASAVSLVPLGFCHAVYTAPGETLLQRVRQAFQPKEAWGPRVRTDRKAWESTLGDSAESLHHHHHTSA